MMAGLFGLAGRPVHAKEAAASYLTGVIPVSEEIRQGLASGIEWIGDREGGVKAAGVSYTLASACKNTLYLPVVREQLLSNCGAYAPSYYYKTYQEARERGWVHPDPAVNPERVMSPGFTFPLTNKGENNGAGLITVLNVICRYGIATWKDMPENPRWWDYPADNIWPKALPYRGDHVIGFDLSTTNGLQALKQHLAGGDLGVFGLPVSTNLRDYPYGGGVHNNVLYTNSTPYSFHAMTVIGYDDTVTYNDGSGMKTGAFLAVNSWGGWGVVEPSVGTAGFCWLGYDYMRFGRAGDSSVLAMVDRTNYVPREVAEITVYHEARSELELAVAPGNGVWSTNGLAAFPRTGGTLPYYGTITVDVTDFMADKPEVYHLSAMDWKTPAVGTIQQFKVRKANGMELVCSQTPVTLLNSVAEEYPNWYRTRLDAGTLEAQNRSVWEGPLQSPMFSWVDFNQDGNVDLVVFGSSATNGVYLNNGKGLFSKQAIALPLLSNVRVAWGDYNRDGYPDVAVAGRDASVNPATLLLRNVGGNDLVSSGITLSQAETGLAWGDYDQDGDLDLATSAGKLYRNDNGTNFVNTGFSLIGGGATSSKSVSWADLDNDGLMDLEINGKINQNLGGSFTNDALNGPAIGTFGDVPPIWHDFNGDGLLDAAAGGRIYQNMGYTLVFSPDRLKLYLLATGAGFTNWSWPRVAAGDFNNDGCLDLAMSGAAGGSSANLRCSVFRGDAGGTFTDIGLLLPGFYYGNAAWGDWDNDGDLDLLAAGMDSAAEPQIAMMANRRADDGLPNHSPAAPQRFQVTQTNQNVLLQWFPATDQETPATRLAYEIRVGRSSGALDVVSPLDPAGGPGQARLIGALTLPSNVTDYYNIWYLNTSGLPGLRLRNLSAGRYYWSVRTVDGGMARSPWSAEQVFTVSASGLRMGDINGDGKVDIADLVRCRKMIAGTVTPDIAKADLNSDGTVNEPDAVALSNLLLENKANGYVPVAQAVIGSAGGTLSNGTFALTVPAGAFASAATLQLLVASDDRWFGDNSPRLMWRIQGLPSSMTGTLTFTGPDLRTSSTSAVALAIGRWGWRMGMNVGDAPIRSFSFVAGTVTNAKLVTQVPAELLNGGQAPVSGGMSAAAVSTAGASEWTNGCDLGWIADDYWRKTTHFKIYWLGLTPPSYLDKLAQELEAAFTYYQAAGYSFVDKRDWVKYPIEVVLRDMPDEGGEVHYTDNGAYIELNIKSITADAYRASTVYHELFHLVQGLVNPSYAITEASDKKLLLLNEATATWMERWGAASPDTPQAYVPPNYKEERLWVFEGLSYGARANATKAGYGFASLIAHVADSNPVNLVRTIYDYIAAGDGAFTALFKAMPDPGGNMSWHHEYYRSLAEGAIYVADPLVSITTKYEPVWPENVHTYTMTGKASPSTSFGVALGGLGAAGYRFALGRDVITNLTETNTLVFSLQNPNRDMNLSVVTAVIKPDARGTIPIESYGSIPEVIRYRVPNLKSAVPLPALSSTPSRSFIAVVTRTDSSNIDDPPGFRGLLRMAVADRLTQPVVLPPVTNSPGSPDGIVSGFPAFACNATLTPQASELTGLSGSGYGSSSEPGVTNHYGWYKIYQDGALSFNLAFSAQQVGPTETIVYESILGPGYYTKYTLDAVSGYMISKQLYNGENPGDQPYVFTKRPFSGNETLVLDANETSAFYTIYIPVDVTVQKYREGEPYGPLETLPVLAMPTFIDLIRE